MSKKQVYEPFADDQLIDVHWWWLLNSRQLEHTKKVFVIEVCLLLSANLNTVHFEQMFVKTLILLVISNNLAFQQVSSPGAEASVVTVISRRSDSDFPPIVACFHRLPGKHWDYCRGLASCFWSIHVLSNSRFLQPNSRVLNYEIPWFQLRFISSLGFNIINLLSLNLSAGLMAGSYARGCNWLQDSMLFINLNINLWQRYESRRRQNASQAQ